MPDFQVIIPSHRPHIAEEARASMVPIVPTMFLNDGYPSFSKLINDCIMFCREEIVIVCNDKARPTAEHEYETVMRILDGYGFVGMHNFRHFGFHKDLIRKIGFFDERFIGGEYEDFDFMRRIKEADIAVYMSREVPCIDIACSWKSSEAYKFNHTKWKEHGSHTERLLPDERYDYNIGEYSGFPFKPYSQSILKNADTPKEFQL